MAEEIAKIKVKPLNLIKKWNVIFVGIVNSNCSQTKPTDVLTLVGFLKINKI